MRFGLAFYELDGPLFAVESHEKSLVLYLAEQDVVKDFKDKIKNIDLEHCRVEFPDLNCLSLDVVENLSAPPWFADAPARPMPKKCRLKPTSSPSGG